MLSFMEKKIHLRDIYSRYNNELYIKNSFVGEALDPNDVLQDVFVKYSLMADPTKVKNPRAYLYRTAHNILKRFEYIAVNTLKRITLHEKYVQEEPFTSRVVPPSFSPSSLT